MARRNASTQICYHCIHAKYKQGESVLASGWICQRNPKKPVAMGIMGDCSKRKEYEQEQYQKK